MEYIGLSAKDIEKMLKEIGVKSIEDLFVDIPRSIYGHPLSIPKGKPEADVMGELEELASKNTVFRAYFCGAGIYRHYIPPVVMQLAARNEFYTSYTPYQPEVSQGILAATFEFQTSICRLTGMEVANAGVYDGATAVAEAITMARKVTGRNKVYVLRPYNPFYGRVLDTYAATADYEVEYIEPKELVEKDLGEYAAAVIQIPDFLGGLPDIEELARPILESDDPKRPLIIISIPEAISLGLLKPPGRFGVDIVTGEAQSLGLPPSFGGPLLGFMAARRKLLRKMPGRIAGATRELEGGRRGFVLTLQTREQHIRRERALSNICSNEALCMLTVQIYLAAMGPGGLRKAASISVANTHYLMDKIRKINGVEIIDRNRPIFNEFPISTPAGTYSRLVEITRKKKFCPPVYLNPILNGPEKVYIGTDLSTSESDILLVCSTELHTAAVLDEFADLLEKAVETAGGEK